MRYLSVIILFLIPTVVSASHYLSYPQIEFSKTYLVSESSNRKVQISFDVSSGLFFKDSDFSVPVRIEFSNLDMEDNINKTSAHLMRSNIPDNTFYVLLDCYVDENQEENGTAVVVIKNNMVREIRTESCAGL